MKNTISISLLAWTLPVTAPANRFTKVRIPLMMDGSSCSP